MATASSSLSDVVPSEPSFGANFIDTTRSMAWFRDHGLMPSKFTCTNCKKSTTECNKAQLQDGKIFHCSSCNKQFSIRSGTIFFKSTLNLATLAYLLFYFSNDVPAFIASRLLHGSITYKAILQWFYKFRNICSKRLLTSPIKFVGTDVALVTGESTVEIDESLFGKKGKTVGGVKRGTSRQKYSVFGIVEKHGRRCVLYYVPDRKRETIFPIIQRHIDTSCKINHDGFVVYDALGPLGYQHSIVCHNLEFVAPDGTHTNTIEGLWGLLKQRISRMHGLPSFSSLAALLDEFSYRQIYSNANGCIWTQLLADIKELGELVSLEENDLQE